MLKAYLAYSHQDKAHVDRVAARLGRAQVVYDSMCFRPGVDFREAIRAGMDQSRLVVLFASRQAIQSTWVTFEVDEAEWRHAQGQQATALTILLDSDVK